MNQTIITTLETYCQNKITRDQYSWHWELLEKFAKSSDILSIDDSDLNKLLVDYVQYLMKKISPNSIPIYLNGIKFILAMNDRTINFKRLSKVSPQYIKKSGYDTWKTKDVRALLESAGSARNRALIHVLCSTGARREAIADLQFKDMEQMPDGFAKVVFYAGSKDEYTGFLTPEANEALKAYLKGRKRQNQEDYVFSTIHKETKCNGTNIREIIKTIVEKTATSRIKEGNRYNIQIVHSFRKFFATRVKLNKDISSAVAEKLLGHKVDLDDSYFRPGKELFEEFKKVAPDLILNIDQQLVKENKELRTSLEAKLEASERRVDRLFSLLEAKGLSVERDNGS